VRRAGHAEESDAEQPVDLPDHLAVNLHAINPHHEVELICKSPIGMPLERPNGVSSIFAPVADMSTTRAGMMFDMPEQ
jgi:hypothetical protein